jgi:uncharacterized protein (DUF58 family)
MSDGITLSLDQLLRPPTLAQLLPSRQVSGQRTGIHQASSKGRGMEFAEVRPYLPGDDVRSIDWRITARTGKPHTKLFREERDRCVYILLDLDPAMYFGSQGQLKARLATILAAATAWQALGQGDKVGGLILLGAEPIRHNPAGRRKDLLLWLQKLLQAYEAGLPRPDSHLNLTEGLKLLNRTVRPGSLIHVISDFYRMSDASWLWLKRLNKSHQVHGYQILDRLEAQLVGQGTLAVDNGRQQGYLTSHEAKFAQHYRQVGMHRQHGIVRQLRESTLRFYCLDTSRPAPAPSGASR